MKIIIKKPYKKKTKTLRRIRKSPFDYWYITVNYNWKKIRVSRVYY